MDKARILRANECDTVEADWGCLTWYASGGLGNSSDMTVGKCVLRPGRENPLHSHPNCSEVLVVLQGQILHTIEGGEIGVDTIQSNEYPIARPLFFYAKKAHIGVIPGMREYMNEFVSDAAVGEYGYLMDRGLVPLDTSTLSKVRSNVKNLNPISM